MMKNSEVLTRLQEEEIVEFFARSFIEEAKVCILPVLRFLELKSINPKKVRNISRLIEKGMIRGAEHLPAIEDLLQKIFEDMAALEKDVLRKILDGLNMPNSECPPR